MGDIDEGLSSGSWGTDLMTGLKGVMLPIFLVIGSVGSVYALFLGFMIAKAEDESKRKAAKSRMIKTLMGVFLLVFLFTLLMSNDWFEGTTSRPKYEAVHQLDLSSAQAEGVPLPGDRKYSIVWTDQPDGAVWIENGNVVKVDPAVGEVVRVVVGETGTGNATSIVLGGNGLPDNGAFVKPVNGKINCGWGCKCSVHNGSHSGIDFPGSMASSKEIYAAAGGTVTAFDKGCTHANKGQNANGTFGCGCGGGWGNYIRIDHGNGVYTLYAHLKTGFTISSGTVSAGQKIATMGTSGRSTGDHLHFEVYVGGTASKNRIDPAGYFK